MWPDSAETDRLLEDAAAGNPDAAGDLLEQHRAALRRVIAMRLDRGIARRIDASDVVQDVLFEASKRLADYLQDPRMPFHVWLRHLALDRMIDVHRRHHAQRRDVGRERPMQAAATSGKSSLDLAAQLQDQELTPAAAALRKELAGGSSRRSINWTSKTGRSCCCGTSNSSATAKRPKRWAWRRRRLGCGTCARCDGCERC